MPHAPFDPARYSRRAVLKSLGLGLGLLPVLEADSYAARRSKDRTCLVLATFTNGVIQDEWFPRGEGADLTKLTLPEVTNPLEPWKKDLLFMKGLELRNFTDYPGHGGAHENYCTVFTGVRGIPKDTGDPRFIPVVSGGISIDQHIANGIAKKARLPFPALHLGCQIEKQGGGEMQARISWRDFGQPNTPEDNPHAVYAALFGGGPKDDAALARLRAERRSLLDHVGDELARFSSRLGQDDRTLVEAHLTSVREIEMQLSAPARPAAGRCARPAVPAGLDHTDRSKFPEMVDVQSALAVAALACDATRIVNLQVNNGNGVGIVFSWLGIEGKGKEFPVRDHHDVAHRPGDKNRDKIAVDQWYMKQCARLIERLAAVRDGGARLLDRTALMWGNHMGNGAGHTSKDLPWVIAGGANGYFKTGRYLRLPDRTPVNGVFVAFANAMGVPTETFGDPRYGGELAALRA